MNSLFAKILLWLVLTAIIAVVGASVVGAVINPQARPSPAWPALAIEFLADEAQQAYRDGGPGGLRGYLDRLREKTQVEAWLVDSRGIGLLDGKDYGPVLDRLRRSPFFFARHQGRLVAGRAASDDEAILLVFPPSRAAFPMLAPHQLWLLGSVVLLSYLLARYLTDPLRRLEAAALRLGGGDLAARAPVERKDEVGRLAAAFNRMAGQLEQLVQSRQRLLLDVSHELRSPLARLNVAVELARSSEDPRQELDLIQRQADRLNDLVGSLLQVARAEASPVRDGVPVRLGALIESIVSACRVEAAAVPCALQFSQIAGGELPGDPELLARAFENVLRNAIRYAPAGSTVEVTLDHGTIAIRDHGPGVPAEALDQLFTPFYRVEGQQSPGIGLGLSIAERAVALHGGTIRAGNANPGLRVVIQLPVTA